MQPRPNQKAVTQTDITFEKPLPFNRDAERKVLGTIILDNSVITQAIEGIKADDIFLPSHRIIYEAMLTLYHRGSGIEPLTLQEELRTHGLLDQVGGPAYLASLFDGVPRFSDIRDAVAIVKKKARLRRFILAGHQIMTWGFDEEMEPDEIAELSAANIYKISEDSQRGGFTHINPLADACIVGIEEASHRKDPITGVRTGFYGIDYVTSGLQPGNLIIVAARPGMGKTSLALNVAENVAVADYVNEKHPDGRKGVVGIFSCEMSKEELVLRLLSSRSMIDMNRLRSGHLKDGTEWRKLIMAMGELSEGGLYIDDTSAISVMEMRAAARKLKQERGALDLLVVDYLQLMSNLGGDGRNRRSENRQQEVSTISRDLKILAKELNCPIIALSQLSRAPETRTGNHKPQLSDLRESGSIEQDADVVMFIYREEVYQPETDRQNIADIIIGKQRNGVAPAVIELVFLKTLTRFVNPVQEH